VLRISDHGRTSNIGRRLYAAVCIACITACAVSAQGQLAEQIGYNALAARLGPDMPTGAGIPVTQVEALYYGQYMPDVNHPDLAGKQITPMSGPSGASDHATNVARRWYGATRLAPGITEVLVYEANHWLNDGAIFGLADRAPLPESQRLQNHSYIFDAGSMSINTDLLRRIDLLADRDGVVIVAGVNNGVTEMPPGLGSAYNVITVGLSSGLSSVGPTKLDVAGRVKPDLVIPGSTTSFAAAYTSSVAALLLESIQTVPDAAALDRTRKALLTKALLMGGATKDEFPDWAQGFGKPDPQDLVPLDYRYGAGEVNIDHSHRILTTGRQPPGEVGATGWDVDQITAGNDRIYFFEIPAGSTAATLSILVTWNRQVTFKPAPDFDQNGIVDILDVQHYLDCANGPEVTPPTGCTDADLDGDNDVDLTDFSLMQRCLGEQSSDRDAVCEGYTGTTSISVTVANIDLALHQATGTTIGARVDRSVSNIDNVEHIFRRSVSAGRYAIVLTTDQDADFALTWDAILDSP